MLYILHVGAFLNHLTLTKSYFFVCDIETISQFTQLILLLKEKKGISD